MKLKFHTWVLFLIAVLMVCTVLPVGDYSSGIVHALWLVLLGGIFLIVFLIAISESFYSLLKKKERFNFTPLVLLTVLSLVVYLSVFTDNNKFWTLKILEAEIQNSQAYGGSLTLYNNQSFAAAVRSAEYSKTFQSDYKMNGDTLYLEREDLIAVTDSLFTTSYLRVNDTLFVPLAHGFDSLSIQEQK